MEKRSDSSPLRKELAVIASDADPLQKFDRIKSLFDRLRPASALKRSLLTQRGPK